MADDAVGRLASSVVELVGGDGRMEVRTEVAEFECVVEVLPLRVGAVVFTVMVQGTYGENVIWATRPDLGWWTFGDDGGRADEDAWEVVDQIVDRGSEGVRHRRIARLFRGGRAARRRTTFPSYRPTPAPPTA